MTTAIFTSLVFVLVTSTLVSGESSGIVLWIASMTSSEVVRASRSLISTVAFASSLRTVALDPRTFRRELPKAALSLELAPNSTRTSPALVCRMDRTSVPVSLGFAFWRISFRISAYDLPSAGLISWPTKTLLSVWGCLVGRYVNFISKILLHILCIFSNLYQSSVSPRCNRSPYF